MPDDDKKTPTGFSGLEDMVSRVVIPAPPPPSFPGTSPLCLDEKSVDRKKHTKFNTWAKLAFGGGVLLFIVLLTKFSVNSNRDTSSKVSPTHPAAPTYAPSDLKPQTVPKPVGLFDDILADGASEAKPKTVPKSVSIEEFLEPEKASTPSKSPKPAKDKEWWKEAPLAGAPAQTKGGKLVPYNGVVLPLTPSAKRPENGYLKGERQTLAGGLSSFTIDNSAGSHDAEIRLYVNGARVRSMFVGWEQLSLPTSWHLAPTGCDTR